MPDLTVKSGRQCVKWYYTSRLPPSVQLKHIKEISDAGIAQVKRVYSELCICTIIRNFSGRLPYVSVFLIPEDRVRPHHVTLSSTAVV